MELNVVLSQVLLRFTWPKFLSSILYLSSVIIFLVVTCFNCITQGYPDLSSIITNEWSPEWYGPCKSIANVPHQFYDFSVGVTGTEVLFAWLVTWHEWQLLIKCYTSWSIPNVFSQ